MLSHIEQINKVHVLIMTETGITSAATAKVLKHFSNWRDQNLARLSERRFF